VTVRAEGYLSARRTGVRAGTAGVTIALDRAMVTRGTVVTAAGTPVPHGTLVFRCGERVVVAATDVAGRFTVGLAPGRHTVARPAESGDRRSEVVLGSIDAGATDVSIVWPE
jgi:hypothetical protein